MGSVESNTPYDDAYRTMYVECDELVLPLLNEVFHEHYTGKERIIRHENEHYFPQQGGAEEKYITDAFLSVTGTTTKRYHMECESVPGGSVLIRMFQYGAQLALADSRVEGNELHVDFPNAAVMFLRSNETTPEQMKIHIHTPNGSVSYDIPTLKIASYSIDDLFEKRLYFLIPFYIFNLEKLLPIYDADEDKLAELLELYSDIQRRLEQRAADGELETFSLEVIRDLSGKVAQNLAKKYKNVKKGIGNLMGGKVLDLEAIRIRNDGRTEGRNEGRSEVILKMLRKGRSPEEIAELIDLPVDYIRSVEKTALRSISYGS